MGKYHVETKPDLLICDPRDTLTRTRSWVRRGSHQALVAEGSPTSAADGVFRSPDPDLTAR